MSYLMWDEGPCPAAAAAAGWGDGRGEDQSRDFHSGSGYGEAAQTGVYFITCLTASYLIFSCRGDILFTNQREWLRMMESGCGPCCQDSSCAGGRLLRVAWTLALDAPWSWQPAARRTHDQLYNCCCWAVGQLSFNKIKYCFYSGLSGGDNENRVDTIVTLYKKYAHGCREKKKVKVLSLTRYMQRFLCIN